MMQALLSAYAEGRLEEAEALARRMTEQFPNHGLGFMVLGAVLMQKGMNEEALFPLQKGAELSPENADAYNNLGVAFLNLGRLDEARNSLERALRIAPDYVEAHNNLGNLLRRLQRLEDAEICYRRALEISGDYAKAHGNLGILLKDAGRLHEARECAMRALQLAPEDADAHNNLGAILLDLGHFEEAEKILRRALQIAPDHPMAHNNLASVLKEMMRREEAEAVYRDALAINPHDADALHGLANLEIEKGRTDDAVLMYRKILQDHPSNIEVRYSLALSGRGDEENFSALAGMDEPLSLRDAVFRHYALGKCFDERGDCENAFLHYSRGARLKRSLLEHRPEAGRFERIARDFDASAMARLMGAGDPSALPVFVLGMPRSGTTLVEQIIASHPEAQAGGELPDLLHIVERDRDGSGPERIAGWGKEYIRSLRARAPDAKRITDKMPANFFAIGLIHAMLPNARIIHVRRDPLDTCLSCYTQLFSRGHEYSYDLFELGKYYRGYAFLMEHWRTTLPPGSFLEVSYEDVVSDLEGQARRMLEYCGLDWDRACLDFHRNERPVQTASLMQVRKPVYGSSVGRWRCYESHLGPLIESLSGAWP